MMALKDNATAPKTPAPPSPPNPNPNSLHADALCVLVAITTTLDRYTFALSPPLSSFASTRFAFGPEGETFSLVKSKLPEGRAMAGASRQMGKCFVSSAKSAFRFCGKSSGDAAASGAGRGGLGMPSMATGRSAPSCSAKSFMETRRPSSSFMFRLPGEMACAQSLLPFHNATASACMVSQLGTSACILIQGMWIIDDA